MNPGKGWADFVLYTEPDKGVVMAGLNAMAVFKEQTVALAQVLGEDQDRTHSRQAYRRAPVPTTRRSPGPGRDPGRPRRAPSAFTVDC